MSKLTHRKLFAWAFAAGLLSTVAAATPASAQSEPVDQALANKAGKSLVFAGSGGHLGAILKGLLAGFTKESGITVEYMEGPLLDLYGRIKAERNRPSIDVYFSSSVAEAKGVQDNVFQPVDPKIVKHLPELYDLAHVEKDLGVRIGVTDLGFIFNKKAYQANNIPFPTKWDDLWDPKVSGRVITGDTTSTYTVLYLAYMTKLLGGNEADPTRGIDFLAEHKKNLLAVVRTYPERIQLLTNGQAWINIDVGFTSLPETVASSDIGYVSPLEGSPLFMLAVHAIKGARNPIGAQLLLNYMISPSVQAQWAKESFVGPVNKNVKLDPELAKQVPYGDSLKRLMPMDYVALSDSLQKYREMWNAKIAQP